MKQPLLLLHGAISSRKQFDVFTPFLSERFDVHALNFPGHGGNEIPAEPFSIPLFAASVISYLDENKITAASVFGYSMGGYVALYLAAHYPERVSKVFTLATKLEWTPHIAERETAQLNAEKILEKVPAFAAALEQTHLPQPWKTVLEKTSAMLFDLGKQPALTNNDFLQIETPVIIGIGELDKMVSIAESQNAAKQLKNGKLLVLPATPHTFEKVNHAMLTEQVNELFL